MTTPSGPGKFSQRTDKAVSEANRSLPNADYGEQAQYQDQLQGAPIATQDVTGMNFNDLFGNASQNVVPLGADSQNPDEPVTAGADEGPGPGSEVLSSTQSQSNATQMAYLPALEWIANQPGSSDAARNMVRNLKASM